ncbi:GumC family protein [Oleiharenicola lentus]|uniref:GumC family protein n=1 Tax=Oleiharenicola lentus TaxID=2508720 RepID=UPI003F66D93D
MQSPLHSNPPDFHNGDDGSSSDIPLGVKLRQVWFLLRERKWYLVLGFLLVCVAGTVWTFGPKPIYESVASVQLLRRAPILLRTVDMVESGVTSDADFNTQWRLLDSVAVLQNVAARLTPEEQRDLLEPLKSGGETTANVVDILFRGRKIMPVRMSLVANIRFAHPNGKVAARMANLIAIEYIAYNTRQRIEESMKVVDDLKARADQQRKRVDEIATAQQTYRQRGNLVSLVQNKDIVTEKLKALNLMGTQTQSRFLDAEIRWQQVQQWTTEGRDLLELPFIAEQGKVTQLILEITRLKLAQGQLEERYNALHPRMIEAAHAIAQAEAEMAIAIKVAASSIRAEYENAKRRNEEARKALGEQEAHSLAVDKLAVEYENIDREFRVNNQLLEAMIARIREASVTGNMELETARFIDRAFEPMRPVSPNIPLYLGATVVLGIFVGSMFAYGVARLDDKVMTPTDVEQFIGLPLLGIIPAEEKSRDPRGTLGRKDGAVNEAFLSLYSLLRVYAETSGARAIAITSTMPGEGKSFVSSRLAETFACQEMRTVIVDCDLRKPTLLQNFQLRKNIGVVDYCLRGASLETIVQKSATPNLDVIVAGTGTHSPVTVLNSVRFAALVEQLREKYDRVIFDTPPLAAVSDVMSLLPLVDGVLYAVKFSGVNRHAAQHTVRKLAQANVPIFGAVLNQADASSGAIYYGRTDRKALKAYQQATMPESGVPA